jgi:hypothetical protein
MGISKTQESFDRIQKLLPEVWETLHYNWTLAFGGGLTLEEFNKSLEENNIISKRTMETAYDVDFIINNIKLTIGSQ